MIVLVLIALLAQAPAAGPETLSEVERLQRDVLILQSRLHRAIDERDEARAQLAPLQHQVDEYRLTQARTALTARIEAAHPCCTFTLETGALDPKAPVAPKP